MSPDDPGLVWLNTADADDAGRTLGACCASPVWVAAMVAGRPYPDRAALVAGSDRELASLSWEQLRVAVDAHPRIGDRVAGDGTEAAWSRREQAGMLTASEQTRADLVAANRAYEERFGHVFLIFATGRTDTEMLAAARDRLSNPDEVERRVVRAELAKIVGLRLSRLGPAETDPSGAARPGPTARPTDSPGPARPARHEKG